MVIVGVVGTWAPRDYIKQKRYKDRALGHARRLWRCQGGRRKSRREGNKYQKGGKGPHPVLKRPRAHPQGHSFRNCGVFYFGETLASSQRAQKEEETGEALTHLRSPERHSGHSGCWRRGGDAEIRVGDSALKMLLRKKRVHREMLGAATGRPSL